MVLLTASQLASAPYAKNIRIQRIARPTQLNFCVTASTGLKL